MSANPKIMSDADYDNLLHIVEAEAGTEDIKGRVLIANVIMNRLSHEEFPDTLQVLFWIREWNSSNFHLFTMVSFMK